VLGLQLGQPVAFLAQLESIFTAELRIFPFFLLHDAVWNKRRDRLGFAFVIYGNKQQISPVDQLLVTIECFPIGLYADFDRGRPVQVTSASRISKSLR